MNTVKGKKPNVWYLERKQNKWYEWDEGYIGVSTKSSLAAS